MRKIIKDLQRARDMLSNLLSDIAVLDEDSEFGGQIESILFHVIEELKIKNDLTTTEESLVNEARHVAKLIDEYNYWADYPGYPSSDWIHDIKEGDTQQGYWQWVFKKIDEKECENGA